jgi:hypothetical protein
MPRKLQAANLGRYENVLVGLGSGQRGGCVQLDEVVFEHISCISA